MAQRLRNGKVILCTGSEHGTSSSIELGRHSPARPNEMPGQY